MNPISEIFLSICIPTNGRIEILKKTLDSIYDDCEVNYLDFEVILSDNSTNNELVLLLESYKKYPNIVYSKTTCEGFLNSANALKMGNGLFLKLHNNYTILNKGSLSQMISFIKANKNIEPLVFFTNGHLNEHDIKLFDSFDLFSSKLSYWNSWSTGFSMWKKDLDKYSNEELNPMFPQTSLLLLLSNKKTFVINDITLFNNQEVPRKGGYNLFKTFCIDYLSIINEAKQKKIITLNTFKKIKKDLFYNYLVISYYNTKIKQNDYTFELLDIRKSVAPNYSISHYYLLVFLAYFTAFKISLREKLVEMKIIKD
ncbi:glycosyltransferase [Flavobacterium aquidurense]|uniref:Glycosyltransferase, group 2 family protein n=1 Tax=Flavobacterium aquidurense TaxID=362413 RepID=A0A0Q0WB37_9FLAO|nr:glycosyltransferase [Flavobacterium aquidurense]KQB41542.1 Glycosyltransferase, group 2 family protein [Flavobacterium aquidurense]